MLFLRLFVLLLCLSFWQAAYAAGSYDYCETVQSTADVLDCVKEHNNNAQKRLNAVFEKLVTEKEAQEDSFLSLSQKKWLEYRNTQCSWEAEKEENPALKRVVELSCLATLTDTRSDLLVLSLDQAFRIGPREFGTFPRWLNVLVGDYPAVFWDVGSRRRFDLDCDGEYEQIISGVMQEEGGQAENFMHAVVAVVENPATGKPHARIFHFPVQLKGENDLSFCKTKLSFAVVSALDSVKKNEQTNVAGACATALQLMDGQCPPVVLYWDGVDYISRAAALPVSSEK